jgi:predicted RNase H-like HicB family nuclease
MIWPAVVEEWPTEVCLYVPDLPGFISKADSGAGALAQANDALDGWIDWLVRSELVEQRPETGAINIVETLVASEGRGPAFALDREPFDAARTELALAVGRSILSDLLYQFDETPIGERPPVLSVLRHVAEMDRWYALRLIPASGKPFESIEDELVQSASFFEETIDAIPNGQWTVEHVIDGEVWTAGKALRRRTAHLHEHLIDLLVTEPST